MERDPRLDAVAASDLSSAAILASLIGMLGAKGILAVRWTRLVRQFGGLAKVEISDPRGLAVKFLIFLIP